MFISTSRDMDTHALCEEHLSHSCVGFVILFLELK